MHEPSSTLAASASTEPAPASDAAVFAFYALTFASGAAALVYQIVWSRMLSLTFGSSSMAAATVVASFMGGMGLGAWLYHRWHRFATRPLAVFVGLEVGIALSTALLSSSFYSLPELFASLVGPLGSESSVGLLRLVSVFAVLCVPATLMGATFPALCAAMIHSVGSLDRHLGRIYGINTIGAAGGAFVAGLFLIERLGLMRSVWVANGLNLLVALGAALLLSTALGARTNERAPATDTAIPTFLPRRWIALLLVASGFSTLSYEMYWIRASRYLMGNSTYALTTTIVVFLLGLGFGATRLEKLVAKGEPERALVMIQLKIAVAAVFGMAIPAVLLGNEGLREHLTIFSIEGMHRPWGLRLLIQVGIAVVAMLPATMFMGLSFPLATRLYLGDVRELGNRVGLASLLANLGSIAGALVGVAWILPELGSIGGTKATALFNLGVALLLVLAAVSGGGVRRWKLPAAGAFVFLVSSCFLLPSTPYFRGEVDQLGLAFDELVFQKEGDLATVQVLQVPGDESRRSMTIDGCSIALSEGFRGGRVWRKQVLLAHLPMTLDTGLVDTLNIGLGGTSTLATLATYDRVRTLDCVEINPAVVEGARLFPESIVLADERVELFVEDAVHYLLRTDRTYDLIVSDGKQHPFFSGNAPLLCREFYENARSCLREDGLFVQWMPLGSLHEDFTVNLRTLAEVFPYTSVFFYPPQSVNVVASLRPLSGRHRPTDEEFRASQAFEDLRGYGLQNVPALLSGWTADRSRLLRVLGDGPVSAWDRLYLDFTPFKASREAWETAARDNLELLVRAEVLPPGEGDDRIALGSFRFQQSSKVMRQAMVQDLSGRLPGALQAAAYAVQMNPEDFAAAQLLELLRVKASAGGHGPGGPGESPSVD